jgi:hypothetical protein
MGKKKSKKVKSCGSSGEKSKPPVQPLTSADTEEKFNFGGLPDIDFKKNLGCG